MGYAPLVSVIVPVYKTEKFIHRCIGSVLNQTYSNWEMILVDDGSPDACGQICDSYAEKMAGFMSSIRKIRDLALPEMQV